jgi:hypothetical protein
MIKNITGQGTIGISRESTLHYLKKNQKSDRPFATYGKVKEKLEIV